MTPVLSCILTWLTLYALHRFGVLSTLAALLFPPSSSTSSQSPSHSSASTLSISWYGLATFSTPLLNPALHLLGTRLSSALQRWFAPAPFTAVAGLVLGEVLLLYNLLSLCYTHALPYLLTLAPPPRPLADANLLSIALPGVTVPLALLPYLSAAVLVAVVCHEAGHALCAEAVGLRVKRVGVFWCLVFPGAWVEVEDEGAEDDAEVDAPAQLAVVAAGVWHNLVLAACGIVVLLALPLLLSPFYVRPDGGGAGGGGGATLLGVDGEVSPALAGTPGLNVGDRLTSVNGVAVGSAAQWREVLRGLYAEPEAHPDGRCLSTAALMESARGHKRQMERLLELKGNRTWEDMDAIVKRGRQPPVALSRPAGVGHVRDLGGPLMVADWVDSPGSVLSFACCVPEMAHHSNFLCFTFNSSDTAQSVCLQPRGLISSASHLCRADADCAALLPPSTRHSALPLEERVSCVTPQLFNPAFRLFVISRSSVSPLSSPVSSSHGEVFFVGSVVELLTAVRCTEYSLRRWLQLLASPSSILFTWLVGFPLTMSRLTQFTVAVSTSLFILNCLPVPLSDGQHALALMAHVATDEGGGSDGGWMVKALQASPRWMWEERWLHRLRLSSVLLFVINVSLTLLPAVVSLAQALTDSTSWTWLG